MKKCFMPDPRSEHERRDSSDVSENHKQLIPLLTRAAQRLAVAAQGLDPQLDQTLTALRRLLRRELNAFAPLAALIDEIDRRIKLIDDERDQRGGLLGRELHAMAGQLLALDPAHDVAASLKSFQKKLKTAVAGADLVLLAELSSLQARTLTEGIDQPSRPGLWSRWFGNGGTDAPAETMTAAWIEPAPAAPSIASDAGETAGEPPFSRISAAVCSVLDNLLSRIEPPPEASEQHRHASERIEKGLNWYELVSMLEQISQIVQAALTQGQGEIHQFLLGLSQRLADADQALQISRQHQAEREQSDAQLNETVRTEVALMRTQIDDATELERLKAQVRLRLESVVDAMDDHKQAEQHRVRALEQQLDTLTVRMREMEAQAVLVEERMVAQQRLAMLDALTQLPNRFAYDERLQQEYQRWLRYQRPLTLAICDIDHFKGINDNYGHLAGDKVLRVVAKALRGRLRKTDFIARFGGEEFVILLPETSADQALHALEKIRLAVAHCPFHFREQPVTVTLSAGLAAFRAGAQPDKVFELADAALYRAKQAGRNRCMLDTQG